MAGLPGDIALNPLKIVSERTVAASFSSAFFISGTLLVLTYYLPYWSQAIKDKTAIKSGVPTPSYLAANFAFPMVTGALVQKTDYFNPPAILEADVACVDCGLLTTLKVNTLTAKWAGYQTFFGAVIGILIQQGIVAFRILIPLDDIPSTTSLILFSQSLAMAVFVTPGSGLLQNKLETAWRQHKCLESIL